MPLTFDLYWSFRSPYCYLAMDRFLELRRTFDVEIALRHVLPGAMRREGYFKILHPNYTAYHRRDTARLAEQLGLAYARPDPDPILLDPDTLEPAADQPHIRRMTRLGVAAAEAGRGWEFLDSVMRLVWDGGTAGWDEGDHLARAVAAAGLDLAALNTVIEHDAERLAAQILTNGEALVDAGHWGVPCMVFDGEPFFGQDRIDALIWRMEQKGLAKR